MKKLAILVLALGLFAVSAWPIKIDGQDRDWANVRTFRKCPIRPLEKDRAGFDMKSIKLLLGNGFLYMYIDGRSVTGLKPDDGAGLKKTSVRVSFRSEQSLLNRVRIAADPDAPWQVKLSYPSISSEVLGSQKNKYWSFIRKKKEAGFEIKIPVYRTQKGIQAGVPDGPLIKTFGSQNSQLSDVQINSVDVATHRLVDTVEFPLHRGDL
jgi:hypothetical protein